MSGPNSQLVVFKLLACLLLVSGMCIVLNHGVTLISSAGFQLLYLAVVGFSPRSLSSVSPWDVAPSPSGRCGRVQHGTGKSKNSQLWATVVSGPAGQLSVGWISWRARGDSVGRTLGVLRSPSTTNRSRKSHRRRETLCRRRVPGMMRLNRIPHRPHWKKRGSCGRFLAGSPLGRRIL